jgi:hypothetical protein
VTATPAALARKTDRKQEAGVVAGVRLTQTGTGHTAQGWLFERVEDTPPYWVATHPSSPRYQMCERALKTLVRRLVRGGNLVPDVKAVR